jgi:riboflavin kinase/FMN adenylyltransferase
MKGSVITLGTLDGVHRGHQAILRRVVGRARALGVPSVVLVFGKPPRHAGIALKKPVLLTTLREKFRILRRLGVAKVKILVFDRKTASTLPEDFFRRTILKCCGAREMVVGPRLTFGKNRSGRLPLLRQLGRRYGVRIHVVLPVRRAGASVSSRRIRALLWRGNVEKANDLLGYPYSVEGRVVKGDQRGRRLGFPTANLEAPPDKILPPGVFWVKVLPASWSPLPGGGVRKGADALCNIGRRPTFASAGHKIHCEVFVLKRHPRLYGKKLRIAFLRRIRRERRFANAPALRRQIAADVRKTTSFTGQGRFGYNFQRN